MKKPFILLLVLMVSITLTSCKQSYSKAPKSKDIPKVEYLIGFSETEKIERILKKYEVNPKKIYKNFPVVLASLTAKQIYEMNGEKSIYSIEKEGIFNKSNFKKMPKPNPEDSHPKSVQQYKSEYSGNGVKVAIIDSGVDITHPALNIKEGISFVGDKDDLKDFTGHGTHVSGIIGAKSNTLEGIAPDADLYIVKILNKRDRGKNSILLSAIDWCLDKKVDIINASISSNKYSEIIDRSFQAAYNQGVLLVASAGNQGVYLKESITYPGAYDSVIAVGAVDNNKKRAIFSSVGKTLEIMAPGKSIYSTEPINRFGYRDGTSIAAPYITGVAALIMEKNPELSNKQVRKILNETAESIGENFLYGSGLVNIENALLYLDKVKEDGK